MALLGFSCCAEPLNSMRCPQDVTTSVTINAANPHHQSSGDSGRGLSMCLAHLLPPTEKLSFQPERADAFSSRSLPRTRRLAQWGNLSSIYPSSRVLPALSP